MRIISLFNLFIYLFIYNYYREIFNIYYYDYEYFYPIKHFTIYISAVFILYMENFIKNNILKNIIGHLILSINVWEVIISAYYHKMYFMGLFGILLELYHLLINNSIWGEPIYFYNYSIPKIDLNNIYIISYSIWIVMISYLFNHNDKIFYGIMMILTLLIPSYFINYKENNLWGSFRVLILSLFFIISDIKTIL